MNEYAEAVVAAARAMKLWPYVMGGTTEAGIDCRGFAFRSFKTVGLQALIGGWQPNVRGEVKWAKDNGRFRDATVKPKRGWLVFYSGPNGKGPDKIQHVGIVIWPLSARRRHGWAISALNPVEDVKEHRLDRLTIFGYCEPEWPAVVVEPPMVDPEPPAPVEPPDYEALYAALRIKADSAIVTLTDD